MSGSKENQQDVVIGGAHRFHNPYFTGALQVQFIGPDFREDLILRAGFAYEQATQGEAWRAVRPAVLRQEVAK